MKEGAERETPLVSAVIVTHNRRNLLKAAVESALAQTWPAMELLVVDDGSADGTEQDMTALEKAQRLRYLRLPQPRGGNAARSLGIREARGAYVALLDDDDAWLPQKTALQAACLRDHPEVGVVSCGKISVYNFDRQEAEDPFLLPEGDLSRTIFTDLHFTTSRLMFRRELLLQAGLFDEELRAWQDYELMLRLCQLTRVGVVRQNLLLYNIVPGDPQRVTNRLKDWEDAVARIHAKHSALLAALPADVRQAHLLMVYREGARRAGRSGDTRSKRKYLGRIFREAPSGANLQKLVHNDPDYAAAPLALRLRAKAGRAARKLGLLKAPRS